MPGRRGQARGEVARARLVDAGLAIFDRLTISELLGEIGPRKVIAELGDVSPGGFYHHFASREAYLEALVEQGALVSEEAAEEAVSHLHDAGDGSSVDVLDLIGRVSEGNFDRRLTLGLNSFRLRVCVWACQHDPVAQEVLRHRYERVTAQYLAVYESMLGRWGREYRPPFTSGSAMAVFHALIDGLALRCGFDPEVTDAQLYVRTVKALTVLVTRADGDDRSLDEVIAAFGPFNAASPTPSDDPEARRRLLDTALARTDADTYGDTTLEEIAADAEVPADVAYRQFRGKHGLAAATFARFLPLLERPLGADLEDGLDPIEVIRRHLGRLADLGVRHRGLTNALLDAVQAAAIRYGSHIGPSDPRSIVPLPQLLAPAVEAGQAQGVVRDDFDAFELAAMVTNLLLLRVMTRQEEPADRVADIVSALALSGIARVP